MRWQSASLETVIQPTPLGKLSDVRSFYTRRLMVVRKMPADLMSVTPVDGMSEPLWSFLSVAYGWIAHADIDTEKLRLFPFSSRLTQIHWRCKIYARRCVANGCQERIYLLGCYLWTSPRARYCETRNSTTTGGQGGCHKALRTRIPAVRGLGIGISTRPYNTSCRYQAARG